MAEIAGLSLAANIFQMVEYGAQFATTAYEIYESGNDAIENFSSLQVLSRNLEEVTQRLETATAEASVSSQGGGLAKLSQECTKTTQEMLKTLERVGLPKDVKPKKRDAMRTAFKAWWNEDKIQNLQRQLDSFRSQWTLQMMEILRSDVAASSEKQEKLLQQFMQEIKIQNSSSSDITRIEAKINEFVIACSTVPGNIPSVENISPEKRIFLEKKFLQQLKYYGMDLRQETVDEAHKETFRWIFDRSDVHNGQWDNLQEWFSSPQQQLYWITGKPGSGKTTLMKLICDAVTEADPDGPRFDLGCEPKDLTVATFFFWAAGGSEMQKSREGLFRTLLYQLLKQHSGLVASTAPDRWEALCLFGDDSTAFTEPELHKILRNCLMALNQQKVLLLIDGLDEFAGRHGDLLRFFFELLNTCSVKICVSSRPWEIFEESFNNRPSLRIHDLTHDDMKYFFLSSMMTSPGFINLKEAEPLYAQALMDQVLDKAQGVFLWVKLVTRSILEALRSGDTIHQLWKLLDHLPDGSIDDLFHQILQDLKPQELARAARYIGLMEAFPTSGPYGKTFIQFFHPFTYALLFSFADEDNPEFSVNLSEQSLQPSPLQSRISTLKKRINSSCKGLVEVIGEKSEDSVCEATDSEILNFTVQYPHRSIMEYLGSSKARAILSKMRVSSPHLRLCAAYLALIKTLRSHENNIEKAQWNLSLNQYFVLCLGQAANVPTEESTSMICIVDELRRISPSVGVGMESYVDSLFYSGNLTDAFIHTMIVYDLARDDQAILIEFLSTTVLYNIIEYVKYNIAQVSGFARHNRSSKWESLQCRLYRFKATAPSNLDLLLQVATTLVRPSPDMIELLLRSGANLHSSVPIYNRRSNALGLRPTIWEVSLARSIKCFSQPGLHEVVDSHCQAAWRQVGRLMVADRVKVDDKSLENALKWLKGYEGLECSLEKCHGTLSKVLKKGLRDLLSDKPRAKATLPQYRVIKVL